MDELDVRTEGTNQDSEENIVPNSRKTKLKTYTRQGLKLSTEETESFAHVAATPRRSHQKEEAKQNDPEADHTTVIWSAMTKVTVKQLGDISKLLTIEWEMLKNCALPDRQHTCTLRHREKKKV